MINPDRPLEGEYSVVKRIDHLKVIIVGEDGVVKRTTSWRGSCLTTTVGHRMEFPRDNVPPLSMSKGHQYKLKIASNSTRLGHA